MSERGLLDAVLDELIDRYGSGEHAGEVVAARREFEERAGRVFEEDDFFEARTAAFLEWYVCERPLSARGWPPAVDLLVSDVGGDPERLEALRAWALSHRSLFVIATLVEGMVVLDDLLGGARFAVEERRQLAGVEQGDVVEARLVGYRDRVLVGRTFFFHPRGVRDVLVGHARRLQAEGKSRSDIVDFAASLRVRAERYQHVPPQRVYEDSTGELKELAR